MTALQPTSIALAALAFAALATAPAARATDEPVMTKSASHAASASSDASARRTLKFKTSHAVPGTLTLAAGAPELADGDKPTLKFAGQTATHVCAIGLPKSGQKVQPGETATVTIKCSTPWQLYDNGLSFDAFEEGKKVGTGTLRP